MSEKCHRPECPCSHLMYQRDRRNERLARNPCTCEYGNCSNCRDRGELKYVEMYHAFIDAGIPYREHQPGVFVFKAQGDKEFFFWPASGKWRQKGKNTVYNSRGAAHVLQILEKNRKTDSPPALLMEDPKTYRLSGDEVVILLGEGEKLLLRRMEDGFVEVLTYDHNEKEWL